MSEVKAAINQHIESRQEGNRPHLGASLIGEPCERKLVYAFRHAKSPKHDGRLLRLFNRGHLEELRFIGYLRAIGFEVQEFGQRLTWHHSSGSYGVREWDEVLPPGEEDVSEDPIEVGMAAKAGVKLRQWRFYDHGGHFAGSGDGKLIVPGEVLRQFDTLPRDTPGLLEFKTSGTKPFVELVRVSEELKTLGGGSAIAKFKPLHFAQMQVYMAKFNLTWGLYCAVNKNDDDLYFEVVPFDPGFAKEQIDKAGRVVAARQLPPRISNSPAWHTCKFCDFRGQCHMGDALERKCRTCRHGVAVDEGRWSCALWNSIIPVDVVPVGCDSWQTITD